MGWLVLCPDHDVSAQLGRFLALDQVTEQQLALLARTLPRAEPIVDGLASRHDGQHTLLVITTVRIVAVTRDGTHARSHDVYLQNVASTSVALPEQSADAHYRIVVSGRQASAWLELMAESAARVALRRQGTPSDATALAHHATLLRRLGAELDAEEPQAYEVVVLPRLIVVEGQAGYYRVFAPEELLAPPPPDSEAGDD